MKNNIYFKGIRDSLPIALGYYAVSITIGIAAAKAGMSLFQSGLASALNFTSTGEFAGFNLIAACGSYIEMALMQLIINARYILMSASLSQKLSPGVSVFKRLVMGMGVTDEIFGISIAAEGELDPMYTIGAITLTIPAWTLGTLTGAVLGSILPEIIVNALGVSLFGMFIAVFVPPARKNKVIASIVVISFVLSYIFNKLPIFGFISDGTKIIILTAVISFFAAVLFPIDTEEDESYEK